MKWLLIAAACFAPGLAFAQGGVKQSGTITPGHLTQWLGNGIIADAGAVATGGLPTTGGTLTGPLIAAGAGTGLSVTNNASVGGILTTLTLTTTGNGTVAGTFGVSGALTASGAGTGLAVTNNETVGGTLGVGGATTLSGAGTGLAVTNNATVGGIFTVGGLATLNGAGTGLSVTNNATVGGTFTASGAATLNGAGTGLAVTNNATIGGTLAVTGASTFTGKATYASSIVARNGGTWSGTSTDQAAIGNNIFWTGTVSGNMGGPAPLGGYFNISSNVDATATGGTVGIVSNVTTGAATTGGVVGLFGTATVGARTANTGTVEYVGIRARAAAVANDGGTSGSPRGAVMGSTTQSGLTTATGMYYYSQTGAEFAMDTWAGNTVDERTGIYILQYSTSAVQGRYTDSAIGIWNQFQPGTGLGWKVGIGIGNGNGGGLFNPVASDGTVMAFLPNPGGDVKVVNNIFDFSKYTSITGYVLWTPNTIISGSGSISAVRHFIGPTATAGTGNQIVIDENGLQVTASTADRNVSIISKGIGIIAFSNGSTTFGYAGSGGVLVNNTGINLGFYGTGPIAKQTGVAVTAAGIHAALTALGLIAP